MVLAVIPNGLFLFRGWSTMGVIYREIESIHRPEAATLVRALLEGGVRCPELRRHGIVRAGVRPSRLAI
jgi:hypothetical protein